MPDRQSVMQELRCHPPFDAMEPADLEFLAERAVREEYPPGHVILGPADGTAQRFFIIARGSVLAEHGISLPDAAGSDWRLSRGECFPVGSLLSHTPVTSSYRALEPTVCYSIGVDEFQQLKNRSPAFGDFVTHRLASLLERSKRVIQHGGARVSEEPTAMDRLLSSLLRRDPVSCRPDASIESALNAMHDRSIGSMIVTDDAMRPLGIFTLHDVLNRVTLPRRDLAEPISGVMSTDLATLPPQATAYEAALAMVRRGIRHVLVVDQGRLVGVVSEKDLFSLQRVSMRQLSRDIKGAQGLDSLRQFSTEIRQLAESMLVQGVAAEQLTQFIASLNDLLTQRIIDLEFGGEELKDIRFCWMALGSEGRFEQTLSTDQDNGIIFEAPPGTRADEVRQRLLPIAVRVNQALDACGFPLCKGDIMASNPGWCLSYDEWQSRFAAWIDSGDPQALLHGSIFFDFRPLHGVSELAQRLRHWLIQHAPANPRFLHQMAENALRNRPPLGLWRDFAVDSGGDHPDTIDLKLNGAALFVDAARIYSLAVGVSHTNTMQRLRAVAPALKISKDELESWIEGFYYIQTLRLRHQHQQHSQGVPMDNRIKPYQLNQLDRSILKEALRQARKLQSRLGLDYRV